MSKTISLKDYKAKRVALKGKAVLDAKEVGLLYAEDLSRSFKELLNNKGGKKNEENK